MTLDEIHKILNDDNIKEIHLDEYDEYYKFTIDPGYIFYSVNMTLAPGINTNNMIPCTPTNYFNELFKNIINIHYYKIKTINGSEIYIDGGRGFSFFYIIKHCFVYPKNYIS